MAKTQQNKTKRPRSGLLIKILILVLLIAVGWQLRNLQARVTAAREENAAYTAQVDELRRENDALAADIAEGPTDEKMAEIARDELDWAYSDEYVFFDKRS